MFFDRLIAINNLDKGDHWFFYAGMLFGSRMKWWGTPGKRPAPHEGLDLCFYYDLAGEIRRLDSRTRIPVMDAGQIYYVSENDFLGRSVFVRHDQKDSTGRYLCSAYAHTTPMPEMVSGRHLQKNEPIAWIASLAGRDLAISEHLHLSLFWMPEDYPKANLSWHTMQSEPLLTFIDPLQYLARKNKLQYTVEAYAK